ncbi:MAG: hypothetical protein IKW74_00330, partial [Thermoguttaceae bacterium]|nr:hypothetical protein [Thermoguttaceae bacterium]
MQKYYFDRKAVFLIKKSEIILFCCFVLLVVSLFSTARGQEQNHAAKQTPQETFRKSVITPMFGIPRVENANIKGKELTISTLLEGVSSPAERYQRLDAYWKLAEKL